MADDLPNTLERSTGECLECGRRIPVGQAFCDDECLRTYYMGILEGYHPLKDEEGDPC